MSPFNRDKEESKNKKGTDQEQKIGQKGSSFQEEHKDIKQSDFERGIADADPTRNSMQEENKKGQQAKNL